MATYTGIAGILVQTREGDPDNPTVGDIYYNSASGLFRVVKSGPTLATITTS